MAKGPDPGELGRGLATIFVVVVAKRVSAPVKKVLKFLRRILFDWKGYAEWVRDESIAAGLLGGSKRWLAIGAVFWGARGVRKAWKRPSRVVLREPLKPGERLVITQVPVKLDRKQRKQGKAAKPSRAGKAAKVAKPAKPATRAS